VRGCERTVGVRRATTEQPCEAVHTAKEVLQNRAGFWQAAAPHR
jgi:hypothetical protein